MSLPLKTRGLTELHDFQLRLYRQRSVGRINRTDYDFIQERIEQIQARIVGMSEVDSNGEEVDL